MRKKRKTGIRRKLIRFTLSSTLLVMTIGLGLGYFLGHRLLMETIGRNHVDIAESLAVTVSEMVENSLDSIKVYAANPDHAAAILERQAAYEGMDEAALRGYFTDMDKKWASAAPDSPLVKAFLTGKSAKRLKTDVLADGTFAEIFTTDKFGGLVAASGKTSDFYQADERWWQEAYNGGKGFIYAGDIEYDKSSGVTALTIAVPVRNEKDEVIGVMKAVINAGILFDPLHRFKLGETGHAVLVNKEGFIIYHAGMSPLSKKLCDDDEFKKITGAPGRYALSRSPHKHDKEMFLAFAFVDDPVLAGNGILWRVFVDQEGAEVFSPVRALFTQMIWITVIMILVLAPVAFYFAGSFVKPIKKLHDATEHIAEGELDHPIEIRTGDEIEQLADSFRDMVSKVRARTEDFKGLYASLEQKVRERTVGLERAQDATMHILEDLQSAKAELEKKSGGLEDSLEKAAKTRQIMISMLEDNNQIRARLEEKLEELKSAQSMLVQSEKLASLGKLVSDMAHEVNNPLMIISGRAQLSEMDAGENGELKENLRIIMDQCQRAKHIIQRLLAFSKPSLGESKKINMNDSINFIIHMVEHQFSLRNVRVERDYAKDLPLAEVDDKQMHEVFINLLNNAAEAMPGGGVITVKTHAENDKVIVEIKDTGGGISRENMPRIFDPFFTTKKEGTGLGLSVCYGIVKAHGGELKYSSKPGRGTTAAVELPVGGGGWPGLKKGE